MTGGREVLTRKNFPSSRLPVLPSSRLSNHVQQPRPRHALAGPVLRHRHRHPILPALERVERDTPAEPEEGAVGLFREAQPDVTLGVTGYAGQFELGLVMAARLGAA